MSASRTYAIAFFNRKDDNDPVQASASWDELVENLGKVRPAGCTAGTCVGAKCPHKDGAGWSPTLYADGATRGLTGLEHVSLLVVDIDHVPSDDEFAAIYARVAAWRHVVHASHSDRPGDRCLRVILDVSRPILATEFARFRRAVLEMFELPADENAKDACRFFYRPSRPADACHPAVDGTGYLYAHSPEGDGKVLDVDAILAIAGDEPESGYSGAPRVIPDFTDAPSLDAQERAARVLAAAWPSSGRHVAQLALAGALAGAGWPVELIADFCCAVAELQEPGNGDYPKRLAAARSSVSKALSGASIQGWPSLIQALGTGGEDAVRAAREALGFELPPKPDPAFVEAMTRKATEVRAEQVASAPVPLAVDLDATLRAVQKKLSARKDPDSLRDAELLKRVNRGEFLTEPSEDLAARKTALAFATLAIVRAAPDGVTDDQIQRRLLASAGNLAQDIPEVIGAARRQAALMPPLSVRTRAPSPAAPGQDLANLPLDEFVVEAAGARAGRPVQSSAHNIRVALRRLGVSFQFNEFARKMYITRTPQQPQQGDASTDGTTVQRVEDHHVIGLMFEIESLFDFSPPKEKLFDLCATIARENSYHPVRDYLDDLDPEQPITDITERWLIDFAGAPDTPYVRAISRIVLVAAVRRVRRPGCTFQEMLVIESPKQGTGKSTALRVLAGEAAWFTDSFKLDDDNRKMMEITAGRWIVEAGELAGLSARDADELKNYLSRTDDTGRPAYAKHEITVPREFIIIGTTNNTQYLKDRTGNRRFWPVRVIKFDLARLAAARDQLWAEASRLEREHPEDSFIRLDESLYAAAEAEQAKRVTDDTYDLVLYEALGDHVGRVHVRDVWKLLGFHEEKMPPTREQMAISSTMQRIGFEKEVVRRSTYYVRGEGPERDVLITVTGSSGSGYRVKSSEAVLGPAAPPPSRHVDRPN